VPKAGIRGGVRRHRGRPGGDYLRARPKSPFVPEMTEIGVCRGPISARDPVSPPLMVIEPMMALIVISDTHTNKMGCYLKRTPKRP
jgi:hypothetical protein